MDIVNLIIALLSCIAAAVTGWCANKAITTTVFFCQHQMEIQLLDRATFLLTDMITRFQFGTPGENKLQLIEERDNEYRAVISQLLALGCIRGPSSTNLTGVKYRCFNMSMRHRMGMKQESEYFQVTDPQLTDIKGLLADLRQCKEDFYSRHMPTFRQLLCRWLKPWLPLQKRIG